MSKKKLIPKHQSGKNIQYVRQNNNPVRFNTETGALEDQVTGESGTMLLPEVRVSPKRYDAYNSSYDRDAIRNFTDWIPGIGDVSQGFDAYNALKDGNYLEAGFLGGTLLLPNILKKPFKFFKGKLKYYPIPKNNIVQTPSYNSWNNNGMMIPNYIEDGINNAVEYINRQVIPLAKKQGNYTQSNYVMNGGHNIFISLEHPEAVKTAGQWEPMDNNRISLFLKYIKNLPKAEFVSTHEYRHMLDTNPSTSNPSSNNNPFRWMINGLRYVLSDYKYQGVRPIQLSDQQKQLLHIAYPSTLIQKLQPWRGSSDISEKIATNSGLRQVFDRQYQLSFKKKPTVDQLNSYINSFDDKKLSEVLINFAEKDGRRDGYITTYNNNGGFKLLNIPHIKKALTTVPMLSGLIYATNDQQKQTEENNIQ